MDRPPFSGNYQNKLDSKGRVSIPAPFRIPLKNDDGISQTYLRPLAKRPCIEGCSVPDFAAHLAALDKMAVGDDDEEDLAISYFSEAVLVESDKEGRIVVPGYLLEHAGVKDTVMFFGAGRRFQIWEPSAGLARIIGARSGVRERNLSLPARASA